MKFLRHGPPGQELPAVAEFGVIFDLRPVTTDIDCAFLAQDGPARARRALTDGRLEAIDLDGRRIGPPLRDPRAVICIGMNYAAHAAESGAEPPSSPVVFLKHPACVVGPDDQVLLPPGSQRTDWEVELAVVIGRTARYLRSPDVALDHVAGYAISNDVSERDYQLVGSGGQWSKGKCCETFNPFGPWLVTPDEVGDPQRLGLRSYVNGEPRQDSSTADMIFSVAFLVHHLSQYMALYPGDIVNTGTPQGVALSGRFPYLRDGDLVTVEIDGLGRQRQAVTAHQEDR